MLKRIALAMLVIGLIGTTVAEAARRQVRLFYAPLVPVVQQLPASLPDLAEANEFHLTANETEADAVITQRGTMDTKLLRGMLGKYESRLGRRDARRALLRNFLADDYNVDLLAWQIENDPTVQLTPMPDTGKPLNDWLTWFVENIDEIIAAIQKLIGLFDDLNPGAMLMQPLHDGYAVWGCKDCDGELHFALVRNRVA